MGISGVRCVAKALFWKLPTNLPDQLLCSGKHLISHENSPTYG